MPLRRGEIIQGYRILEDFRVAGGMSKISFAELGGKEYFIKEFLYPKYPTADSPGSEKIKSQKRKACDTFENHHRKLNQLIATKVSLGGNLVYAISFFRDGASYYKVNEKIDTSSLEPKIIATLPKDKIITIARSVCHSVAILHDLNIVHGDLKPDNILIKETSRNNYSGKLIDFDDSYFSENPPSDRKCIVGTPEYYSPELAAYILDEDDETEGSSLTLASDVFTLGIIFAEYFTGEKPITGTTLPTWNAIEKGNPISFAKSIDPQIEELLKSMLSLNPNDRPSVKKIQLKLKDIKEGKTSTSVPMSVETRAPRVGLRGRGLGVGTSTPSSTPIPKTPPKPKPEPEKPVKVGLRGSGLKIADK